MKEQKVVKEKDISVEVSLSVEEGGIKRTGKGAKEHGGKFVTAA